MRRELSRPESSAACSCFRHLFIPLSSAVPKYIEKNDIFLMKEINQVFRMYWEGLHTEERQSSAVTCKCLLGTCIIWDCFVLIIYFRMLLPGMVLSNTKPTKPPTNILVPSRTEIIWSAISLPVRKNKVDRGLTKTATRCGFRIKCKVSGFKTE